MSTASIATGQESGARMRGRFSSRLSNRARGGRHQSFRRIPEFYRLVVESLSEYAVLTTDMDLKISSWSRGASIFFGYTEAEIIGRSIGTLFTPEDVAQGIDRSEFQQALEKGRMDDERWHVRKDGRRRWCYGLSFPLKDERGAVRGFVKLVRDDTDRKGKDNTLRESEERLRLAAESTGLGTWDYDLSTGNLKLSKHARRLFGFKASVRTSYKRLLDAVHPEDRPQITAGFHRWTKGGNHNVSLEYRVRMPDGELRWIRARAKAFFDLQAGDSPIRIIGTVVDVTDHKKAQADSARANLELEARVKERTSALTGLNKELETFAYSASHDLRAPLRKIKAFTQAILEGGRSKLDAEDQKYFARIRAAAGHMDHLIDEILNLAHVTQQPIVLTDFNLSAIAAKIGADLQKSEPSRRVDLVVERGLRVHGDRDLLSIALRNLLGNAWKFTSKHAEARVQFGRKLVDGQSVYFVRDDGAGFDMKSAGKLFGAFQRLHQAEDFPGTGIGLGMVERIIRRHKGRIWAEARLEEGATFNFTLGTENQ